MIFSTTWFETKAEFTELQKNIIDVMKEKHQNTNPMVPEMKSQVSLSEYTLNVEQSNLRNQNYL